MSRVKGLGSRVDKTLEPSIFSYLSFIIQNSVVLRKNWLHLLPPVKTGGWSSVKSSKDDCSNISIVEDTRCMVRFPTTAVFGIERLAQSVSTDFPHFQPSVSTGGNRGCQSF